MCRIFSGKIKLRNYQDSKSKEKIVLFLRGGPGVGKSTLAPILAKKISFSAKIISGSSWIYVLIC